MLIAVPQEVVTGERRVALVPETVKRLVGRKFEVVVETGAGAAANHSDDDYRNAGARIEPNADALYAAADLLVKIQAPTPTEIKRLRADPR